MVSLLFTAGVFLGSVVLAAAILILAFLGVTWWASRKRDRAFLASQAKMAQGLDDQDSFEIEHPQQHREIVRKRFAVYADDPTLIERFKQSHFTMYLEAGTIMLAEVDIRDPKSRKAAWEQEQADTEELSNVKPLEPNQEDELDKVVGAASPERRFHEGNFNGGSSSPKQGRVN